MMTIAIKINFKDKDIQRLASATWFCSTLDHWKLNSSDVFRKYKFEWSYPLECSYKMSAEEFLELVGTNEDEALEILYDNYRRDEEMKKYITPAVKEFYKELEKTELLYVEFTLVDQS